jgi:hypothetical protein
MPFLNLRFFPLLIAMLFSSQVYANRDITFMGEKGGAYLASVGIAQHLKNTRCFNAWLSANQWESLPQAFDEFSKVIITELVLQNPQATRRQIENVYEAQRGKIEQMVYKETEKFKGIQVSDEECRIEGPKVKNFMMNAYKEWKLLKDGSAWEFYANASPAPQVQAAQNQISPVLAKPKPTIDDALEGAQRIDFFKKLMDLGVITKEEFAIKRAEILKTM